MLVIGAPCCRSCPAACGDRIRAAALPICQAICCRCCGVLFPIMEENCRRSSPLLPAVAARFSAEMGAKYPQNTHGGEIFLH